MAVSFDPADQGDAQREFTNDPLLPPGKTPSGEDRETMQAHWGRVAVRIAGMAET
jgi:hypothetical protein